MSASVLAGIAEKRGEIRLGNADQTAELVSAQLARLDPTADRPLGGAEPLRDRGHGQHAIDVVIDLGHRRGSSRIAGPVNDNGEGVCVAP